MAVIRNNLKDHIRINNLGRDTQVGFSEGSRIENCLFILRYYIERSFKIKKPLVVISIDFAKAYDRVKRGKLIETLKNKEVDPDIINLISGVYVGDRSGRNRSNKWDKAGMYSINCSL